MDIEHLKQRIKHWKKVARDLDLQADNETSTGSAWSLRMRAGGARQHADKLIRLLKLAEVQ